MMSFEFWVKFKLPLKNDRAVIIGLLTKYQMSVNPMLFLDI